MLKRYIFKDLDIGILNLNNVIQEVSRKNMTGFLRVVYWTRDEYLLFHEGEPFQGVIFHTDGQRTNFESDKFSLKDEEGSATLVETTLDDLVSIQEFRISPDTEGAFFIFPYGLQVQEPVSLNFVDFDKEMLLAKRSHLDGYMAIYSPSELFGIVVFESGNPVTVLSANGSLGQSAINYINANIIPARSYLSVYNLEPEIVSFMCSMWGDNVREVKLNSDNYANVKDYIASKNMDAVVLLESGGICRYDLFFRGHLVDTMVKDKGIFIYDEDEKHRLAVKVENLPDKRMKVFEVRILQELNPVNVMIETKQDIHQETQDKVPVEKVSAIRSAFIQDIGPIGRLIWDRLLNEYGLRETDININQLKLIIEKLRAEFPEEEARKDFIRRVKEILPDIT